MLRSALIRARPLARAAGAAPRRSIITLSESKYTASAVASGAGRNGQVASVGDAEKPLTLTLSSPKTLGGPGTGHNPEQLFAMGYASCFLGALQFVASKAGKASLAQDAKIHTAVHLGTPDSMPGFGINVDIKVEGVPDDALIQAAHEFCPYSRIMTHGAKVTVGKL